VWSATVTATAQLHCVIDQLPVEATMSRGQASAHRAPRQQVLIDHTHRVSQVPISAEPARQ